ncbi:MAG: hypothetical protein RIR09_41, partial [Pseudomonadota bacterium]
FLASSPRKMCVSSYKNNSNCYGQRFELQVVISQTNQCQRGRYQGFWH